MSSRFTPSELIVLLPDRFTEEGGVLTEKVWLPDGRSLASGPLGRAVAQAALLANEAAGTLRLEHHEGKALFGLMRTRTLRAVPTGAAADWPAGSVEAAVLASLAGGPLEIRRVVETVIGGERTDPAAGLVLHVQQGLGDRGLLVGEQAKVMKVFTVSRFVLADGTLAAATAQGAEGVEAMLARAAAERPELWRDLEKGVRTGIDFMRASAGD